MQQQTSKNKRSQDARLLLNLSQYEIVERVADQVCVDIPARNTNNYDNFNPLSWSMHGGPGAGKSHVIKSSKTELFDDTVKFKFAEDVRIVALQAVMADLLGGDTIHHALNLPVVGKR